MTTIVTEDWRIWSGRSSRTGLSRLVPPVLWCLRPQLRRRPAMAPGDDEPATGMEEIGRFGNRGAVRRECRPTTMYNCPFLPSGIQSHGSNRTQSHGGEILFGKLRPFRRRDNSGSPSERGLCPPFGRDRPDRTALPESKPAEKAHGIHCATFNTQSRQTGPFVPDIAVMVVPGGGVEPPTRGFSVHCSTTELPRRQRTQLRQGTFTVHRSSEI